MTHEIITIQENQNIWVSKEFNEKHIEALETCKLR